MTYKWSCARKVQDCVHHISLRVRLPARLTRRTGLYDFDRSAGSTRHAIVQLRAEKGRPISKARVNEDEDGRSSAA